MDFIRFISKGGVYAAPEPTTWRELKSVCLTLGELIKICMTEGTRVKVVTLYLKKEKGTGQEKN